MTLIDALATIFGGIWAVISSPLAVIVYGAALAAFAFFCSLLPVFASGYEIWRKGETFERAVWGLTGLLLLICGVALAMWGGSSASQFVWMAS